MSSSSLRMTSRAVVVPCDVRKTECVCVCVYVCMFACMFVWIMQDSDTCL